MTETVRMEIKIEVGDNNICGKLDYPNNAYGQAESHRFLESIFGYNISGRTQVYLKDPKNEDI